MDSPLLKLNENLRELSILRIFLFAGPIILCFLALMGANYSISTTNKISLIQGPKIHEWMDISAPTSNNPIQPVHRDEIIGKGLGGTLVVPEGFRHDEYFTTRHQRTINARPASNFPSEQKDIFPRTDDITVKQQYILQRNAESLSKV